MFIHGDVGQGSAVGLKATAARLIVAGGLTGTTSVYNRYTAARTARFSNGRRFNKSNVNDVAIAPNGDAYLTDLYLSKIYRIPATALARNQRVVQKLPLFLNLSGTAFPRLDLNANGIEVTSDGRYLLVAQYHEGQLYRIRLSDKQVTRVDLHGRTLFQPDGIVLTDADVLYVVEHNLGIAEVRLGDYYKSGRIVSKTVNPRLQCPTTDAIAGDRLLVVNGQFCGPGKPPFTVSSIPLP